MRFSAREPTGEILQTRRFADGRDDAVCTRILRLAGLEPRLNQGGFCDSYRRCIYVHGTPHEGHIGQPASIGCIRMKNTDVVRLFDTLCIGSLIYIFKLPA